MQAPIVVALAFVAALPAHAGVQYAFLPSPASTMDTVRFRADIDGCLFAPYVAHVDEATRTVVVRYEGSKLPCDPGVPANVASPRFVDIGPLAKGVYTARVEACTHFAPVYTCSTLYQQSLAVFAPSSTPFRVPAGSAAGWLGLGLIAGLAALRRLRENRG